MEMVKDTWVIPPAKAPKRGSGDPPPFPDELVRRLVLLFSAPGDTVLDPFSGSGTTVRVSAAEGRRAIGSDRSADYLTATAERLALEPLQLPTGPFCPVCEALLLSGRRDRGYCSPACRQRAYRDRRRAS